MTLDGSGNVSGPYIVWLDTLGNVIGPYDGDVPFGMQGPPWPSVPHFFDLTGPYIYRKRKCDARGKSRCNPYKSIRGDSQSWFDDVGCYNGYIRTANSADISGYTLKVKVYYVSKNDPDSPSGVQTYYKRIDVNVTHPIYLTKALTFSAIATY